MLSPLTFQNGQVHTRGTPGSVAAAFFRNAACWKIVLRSSVGILFGFVAAVWLGQLPIYLFTSIYIEALNQTGYARGLIHLLPIVIMISVILLQNILHRKNTEISV